MTAYNEYGRALFLLAEEESNIEVIRTDAGIILSILSENPEYTRILDTPAIPKEERLALIDEAFSGISDNVKNLVKILCEQRGVHTFPDVYNTLLALYNEKMGIIDVEAVTAIPMSDGQIRALCEKLTALTGKRPVIRNTVDPEILGGMKLRYLGIQVDGSVKTKLDGFADSLKNIVI